MEPAVDDNVDTWTLVTSLASVDRSSGVFALPQYYKTGQLERAKVSTSIATQGYVIKNCALQKHELYRVLKNIRYFCIVMLLLLALPANFSPPCLLNPARLSVIGPVPPSLPPPLPFIFH